MGSCGCEAACPLLTIDRFVVVLSPGRAMFTRTAHLAARFTPEELAVVKACARRLFATFARSPACAPHGARGVELRGSVVDSVLLPRVNGGQS